MSVVGERSQMYVGGAWVGAASGKTMRVTNPATGEALAELPDAGRDDAWKAVDEAAKAFAAWAATPGLERGKILRRIFELMTEQRDDLARLVTEENGKPFDEARRQPLGVVGAITPWNFPATMVTRKIAPALAAGCTVVLKPASATPLTALALARICEAAGLPSGVFNVLTSKNSGVIGQVFLDHPALRKIAFTGSTEVGKRLMAGASQQLKRVSFELGGNAPFIVFDDADLAPAADGAVGIKFLRVAGQSCICANRLYVQESIAAKFIPMFIERVNALKVAPGFEAGAQIGPLINAEILSKVDGLVQSAVHSGARLDTGGRRLTNGVYSKGLFYAPTVLTQVREEMAVAREEIFGPVAPVMTFNDEAEVIQRSNNTTFGLAAYFYTRDLRRAIRVAEALEYGMVGVNDATGYTHEIPFGGYKESGLGREGGKQGIEEYMEVKSISVGTSP